MQEIILPCGCHKITDDGNIHSSNEQYSTPGKRGIQTVKGKAWKKLAGTKTKRGYIQILLHGRCIRLNRLIAQNFIPNPLCYPEAQHINDIKTDNRVANLKWGNQKHNAEDRERNGNSVHGARSPRAKLNDAAIIFIRRARENRTHTLNQLADKYSVSKKLILLVEQRKIWHHL